MYPSILLLITIGVTLVWFGLSFFFRRRKSSVGETLKIETAPARKPTCPLCSAALGDGENIRSRVFPQSVRLINEKIVGIRGCPHCLHGERLRICPVCSTLLSIEDALVARMVENAGKTSVKIFGCSKCREVPR